jgi:uncharacterized membrane protein
MFLDYLALVMLIIGISLVIYTFIYIHDIPYQIAKKRDHSQKEAIHLACCPLGREQGDGRQAVRA